MNLCVPLTAATVAQALEELPQAEAAAELVELRLDYLRDLTPAGLEELLAARHKPVIATCRPQSEGGRYEGPEDERLAWLRRAVAGGAEHIDVELSTAAEARTDLIRQAHAAGRRVLVSFHDFQRMPPLAELRDRAEAAWAAGADVAKVVGLARRLEDNWPILELVREARAQGRDLIALAMGPAGRLSRVVTPLLGAYLTFASLAAGRESAPGQMTPDELRQIWGKLVG